MNTYEMLKRYLEEGERLPSPEGEWWFKKNPNLETTREPKEEKMENYKRILIECEKMAKKYNLEMEGEWIPMDKLLNVSFKQVSGIWIAAEKTFEIHNVDQKDPAKVLKTIERGLIKKFNIDLNKFEPVKVPPIKNVIFNDPATIIFWTDGTKTVVKAQDEAYDPEKGMAMAIAKKALGNQGNYCNVFKKWLPEEEEKVKESTIIGEVIDRVLHPDGSMEIKCTTDTDGIMWVKGIIE